MIRMLAPYFIGAALVATVIGGAIYVGVSWERDRRAADDARDYITGTEDARDAPNTVPDDQPGLIDWLLKFSE